MKPKPKKKTIELSTEKKKKKEDAFSLCPSLDAVSPPDIGDKRGYPNLRRWWYAGVF
jgi:hypothetical protein